MMENKIDDIVKYNLKSPAVKRLMQEYKLYLNQPSQQFVLQPLEDNLFDWHFTLLGPANTEFENGRYHGRMIFPTEYPFKPPSIMLLTPNGRFQPNTKICLSVTGYHPEFWQPAWSASTVLLALISFFPTPAEGAVGGLDTSKDTRKGLALKSYNYHCLQCDIKLNELTDLSYDTESKLSGSDKEFLELVSFKPEKEIKEDSKILEVENNQKEIKMEVENNQEDNKVEIQNSQQEEEEEEELDQALTNNEPIVNLIPTTITPPPQILITTPPQVPTTVTRPSTFYIDSLIIVTLVYLIYFLL